MLFLRSSSVVTARSLVLVSGLAAVAAPAHAANISWSGNVGNWGIAGNWVGGAVPGNNDNVTVDQANASVTLDGANSTIRSFALNKDTAAVTVKSRTLKTNFASSVAKGTLNFHGSAAGAAKLDIVDNFVVGNGGKLVLDAPVTAGEASIFGTLTFSLNIESGGQLNIEKGMGGKRSIFGNVTNGGVVSVKQDTTVDITAGFGVFSPSFDNTGGDVRVDAGAFFFVKGDDVDKATFTMKKVGATDNKLLTGKGFGMEKLTFDYQSGLIRNAADNDRGGLTLTDCRLKLGATGDFLGIVHGLDSRIATSMKGTKQELYVTGANNNVGANLTYEGAAAFENKGKISFATRNNTNNIDFDATGKQIDNSGTIQTLGGGKVTLKGQLINRGSFSVQTPTLLDGGNLIHANQAAGTISFDAEGITLEHKKSISNFGKITLQKGLKKGTLKGVNAAVNAKAVNKPLGTIDAAVANQGGLAPRPFDAATLTGNTADRSVGSDPSVLVFDGGLDCEPGSFMRTTLDGLSPLSFDWGVVSAINGGMDLGGSSYVLFLNGSEPSPGFSFPIVFSDTPITGTFDLGGVSDMLYPVGGSGSLRFRVDYNVAGSVGLDTGYLVTLTAEVVPTPGSVSLAAAAGLLGFRRRR